MKEKYTVFIRLYPHVKTEDREVFRGDLLEILKTHRGKEVNSSEYEIEVEDKVRTWNDLRNLCADKGFLIWYNHDWGGVSFQREPTGLASELAKLLDSSSQDQLQKIRELIQSTL